ncbi:MAG: GNAT family N-acetyltransferase, partial [Rhodothermales bacterium]|nr:GNAT family N-acetyltransferase [Rhodothermales bacterium]
AVYNSPENMERYVDEHFTREKIEASLTNADNTFFLVGGADGELIGFAKVTKSVQESCVTGHAVELERIYVHSSATGMGIGSQLMKHVFEAARSSGFDCVWLGVWIRNKKAIAFYQKWGFEPVGTHVFTLGGEAQTDLVMQRFVGREPGTQRYSDS